MTAAARSLSRWSAAALAVLLAVGGAAPAEAASAACPVDDATLTWGFKESFRSYISGSIANGEWTVADGASYATPDFSWSGGQGSYGAGGVVDFPGSIRFTGHGGILDTTVANPQLRFVDADADTALLLLDVSGTTQDGAVVDAPGVEFVALDLSAATTEEANGVVTVTDAPAVLTPAGASAFGTYAAGEPFDPVTVTVDIGSACETAGLAAPDAPWWILWPTLALAVIAALVIVLLRRRARSA